MPTHCHIHVKVGIVLEVTTALCGLLITKTWTRNYDVLHASAARIITRVSVYTRIFTMPFVP